MHPAEAVEFSRPVAVDRIATRSMQLEIEANGAERAALAERFSLLNLERLAARFTLRRLRKDQIRVKGRVEARLVQACVVTLDPVPAEIAEDFELDFVEATAGRSGGAAAELDLDFDVADGPEILSGPEIDLGEIVAEQLGLAIDPYPRKAGAMVPAKWTAEPTPEPASVEKVNPFAALERLRKRDGGA